jgi:hypothetical protein
MLGTESMRFVHGFRVRGHNVWELKHFGVAAGWP